jgi:transglutaminase-like putative cysteine protease
MNKSRRFEITYDVKVPDFPKSAKEINVWVPFPRSTRDQEIHAIDVQSNIDYKIEFESIYGNFVLCAAIDTSTINHIDLVITTTATRYERNTDTQRFVELPHTEQLQHQAQLQPNKLIQFTADILGIARNIKAQNSSAMDIAKAAYDHVLEHMEYDKSGDGWGNGDAEFACSIGKGNCTDFHSLFLAIIRACGVPGQFEIGMAFPTGATQGDITAFKCGYHCWTSFYAHGIGWVPVDCSEAAQKTDLRDYYFGSIDENRFLLSYGRDLLLPGRATDEPLNFFTDPIIETASGRSIYYEKKLTFTDI